MSAGEAPLIVDVIVNADDIKTVFGATKFGADPAGDHVPRFELTLALGFRMRLIVWAVGEGHYIHDRIDLEKADRRVYLPHRAD